MNIKWESTEPDRSGYRMPAEWESHDRIWMGWPQRPDVWRDKAGPGTKAFVQVLFAVPAALGHGYVAPFP